MVGVLEAEAQTKIANLIVNSTKKQTCVSVKQEIIAMTVIVTFRSRFWKVSSELRLKLNSV
jgi:hypothetical protein